MKACYDLNQSPATYDFVHWLVAVERARQARGETDLHIVFVQGERARSERDFSFSPDRKAWRLQHLLVPLCRLLPSVTSYEVGQTGVQDISYHPSGYQGVYFKPTEAAQDLMAAWCRTSKPIVTISIRQSDFQLPRNSNRAEWRIMADWLDSQGYHVIIVPDTEALLANEPMPEFDGLRLCPPAAMEPDLRLALYDRAVLNLYTSSGPFALALYGGVPLYMCKVLVPGIHSCTEAVQRKLGLTPDTPLNPYQRVSWQDDTFASIKPEVEELLAVCATRQRPLKKFYAFAVRNADRLTNIASSMSRGLETVQCLPKHDRTMAIVCFGPSLKESWRQIPQRGGDVFTCSGAHDFLMERGIVPMGHVMTDPRPEQADFLQFHHPLITYYPASCCDPSVFDRLQDRAVKLWHADEGEAIETEVVKHDPHAFFIGNGSNVGLRMIGLGSALGYRKFIIYGMDCSLEEGQRHAGAHPGKAQKPIPVTLANGQPFQTTTQLISGAREALALFSQLVPLGYTFDLVGHGLLAAMVQVATQPQEVPA